MWLDGPFGISSVAPFRPSGNPPGDPRAAPAISQSNSLRLTYGAVMRKAGLAPGKLPPAMMVKLLAKLRTDDPSVNLGPAIGEDAAAIRLGGDRYLISKTDPITFTAQGAPALLLQVNANDLATRGALPRYLQVAALFPPGTNALSSSASPSSIPRHENWE